MVSPYAYAGLKDMNLVSDNPAEVNLAVNDIIKKVCSYYKVIPQMVMAKGRREPWVTVRKICIYFIREKTSLTVKQIGMIFNHRDHTTAIFCHKSIKEQLEIKVDTKLKQDIDKLKMII